MTARPLAAATLLLALASASLAASAIQDARGARAERETLEDGSVVERTVVDGPGGEPVRHGPWTRRSADGEVVLEEGEYEDGERAGRWTTRHPSGELRERGTYRDGARHGRWLAWYESGERRSEGRYKEGARDGVWEFFREDGELDPVDSGRYERSVERGPDGRVTAEGERLDGTPHGVWRFRRRDGSLALRATFRRGRAHGRWDLWHVDGTWDPQLVTGAYAGGRRVGPAVAPREVAAADAGATVVPPLGVSAPRVVDGIDATDERLAILATDSPEWTPGELERLASLGRAPLVPAIARLEGLDLARDEDAAIARGLCEAVLPSLCGGWRFAWPEDGSPSAAAARKLAVMRWATLASRFLADEVLWKLARASAAGREELDATTLELPPPIALEAPEPGPSDRGGPGPPRAVARAVADALDWLVRHRSADGHWDAEAFAESCEPGSRCEGAGSEWHDLGVTGLALLALIAEGSDLHRGTHADEVGDAAAWIVARQDRGNGRIGTVRRYPDPKKEDAWVVQRVLGFVYEHAITTSALCRLLARSREPLLEDAAREAVLAAQRMRNPRSGWRYSPVPDGEVDTSVTGWMVAALADAQDAELAVHPACFEGALDWVSSVSDPDTGRVGYVEPNSVSARSIFNARYPVEKSEAMTAMGLRVRLACGQTPESEAILGAHVDRLLRCLPEWDVDPEAPGCDMYYWYHGSEAMALVGGEGAESWRDALEEALVENQRAEGCARGSWDPVGPWGYSGGRVYSTALSALALGAAYR